MSGSNAGKRKVPGARKPEFEHWLNERCRIALAAGLPIDKVRVVRTSSQDPEQFRASMTTSIWNWTAAP